MSAEVVPARAWECWRCGRKARSPYVDPDHTRRTYRAHLRRAHGIKRSDREWTDEEKARQSEAMKAMWEEGRIKRTPTTTERLRRDMQVVADRGFRVLPERESVSDERFLIQVVVPVG